MILVAVPAGLALFLLARRWELDGRPERWVGLVLVVLLVESLLYPSQVDVPTGPFRIPLLGGGVRSHDMLIVIGLAARATVRPLPSRIRLDGALWFVTAVWFATAGVRGLLAGNPSNIVFFSMGSVVGLFGGLALVAGCDPVRLGAMFRKPFVVPLGLTLLLLIPNTASDAPITILGTNLGVISVDTASVFVALAVIVVLVEWSSPRPNTLAVWMCVPLLLTPLAIEQRATLLHVGASALVLAWGVAHSRWTSRMYVPRVRLLWGFMLVLGGLMAVLMVSLSREEGSVPLAGYYEQTFAAEGQQLSAQARRDSFAVGIEEWQQQPVFGHGLGHTYTIVRPGSREAVEPATFDNVPLDILVRTGIVGALLFWSATVVSIVTGLKMWRVHPERIVAALSLGAVAVIVGLAVKSGFESILEKGKLAVVFGFAAGTIAAAAHSLDRDRSIDRRPTVGARTWT